MGTHIYIYMYCHVDLSYVYLNCYIVQYFFDFLVFITPTFGIFQHNTDEKNSKHNASNTSLACKADKCSANTTYNSRC